jgi:ribose transport system ATP-binding protein
MVSLAFTRTEEGQAMSNSGLSNTGNNDAVLAMTGISKQFPGVKVLSGANFTVRAGEVHALCGENGAGKSTLMKIAAGTHQPDAGTIRFDGHVVKFADPLEAKRAGVLLVHQEISLVPELSVAENLFLGSLPTIGGRVDWKTLTRNTREVLREFNCDVEPLEPVRNLSIARQQIVEIARAAAFSSKLVIFDEPTASLTDEEAENLFANIARLKASGTAIVYISHKMKEIFRLSDRVTVLRDGEVRSTLDTAQTNDDEITRLMIGRSLDHYFERAKENFGAEVIRLENVCSGFVRDVSMTIREGEVVGLYGLVGAGRSELAEAIFGVRSLDSGRIIWRGTEVSVADTRAAMKLGIGLVPEDRKRQGLVLGMGGRSNTSLTLLDRVSSLGFIRRLSENSLFNEYRERLSIKTSGPYQTVGTLSGGNQQKFVIAKWLATHPKLLILDEPTRGIDVGAKAEIHSLIARLAESGLAVLVISSEMPEIMGVCHRIVTMYHGRCSSELQGREIDEDHLIAGATGHQWSGRDAFQPMGSA